MTTDTGPLFTVFTASYNRAASLPRVWESLKAQTYRNFEWLVVDDGSTDDTRQLIEGYAKEADFPVRYLWQPNQHKKVAYNHATREAHGQLILPLDSDDSCVPQSLERLHWHWMNIPESERPGFSAVTVLCMDEQGDIVGTRFPGGEWQDSTGVEMEHRWKVRGEKWGFQRIEALRRFPFPSDIKGCVPEGYVWRQIDEVYRTRFVNEALRVYYRDQADSQITTASSNPASSADGNVLGYAQDLRSSLRWWAHDPLNLTKSAANLVRLALHSTLPHKRIWQEAWVEQSYPARLLLLAAAPLGILVWARDRLRW
jgi:glycosyltransferase involved in cell wall biosynthesis